ncbi:MAG: hypothetical protein B6D72_07525 [gamma proteobacterium symbiont of Ctena orbiculata]|nr:MAG: hypothetical protein B6D72_07525 [gamma proteobacterium symbiont of Ctena orbiculata]
MYGQKPSIVSTLLLLATLILGACGSVPKIPAAGKLFGETVNTTVDSEIARYYLEDYLNGNHENREMDIKISALYRNSGNPIPTREELKRIANDFSVDFASLFLADRLLNIECNKQINQSFSHLLNTTIAADADPSSYLALFVPGWDYVETGYLTGSDFAKPRILATQFGLENYLVELPPTGGVEENASVLANAITKYLGTDKKMLIVGASSAGPAIHLALSDRFTGNEPDSIKAWINLGGILQGSPVVDHYRVWYRRWFLSLVAWHKDWDLEAITSMSAKESRRRFAELQIDPDILVINYLGIPLSGQISRYSRDNYPLLRSDGPNDGLTLLTDAIAPQSLTIVALGSDHFFAEDPRIDEKTVALMKLILTYLEDDKAKDC